MISLLRNLDMNTFILFSISITSIMTILIDFFMNLRIDKDFYFSPSQLAYVKHGKKGNLDCILMSLLGKNLIKFDKDIIQTLERKESIEVLEIEEEVLKGIGRFICYYDLIKNKVLLDSIKKHMKIELKMLKEAKVINGINERLIYLLPYFILFLLASYRLYLRFNFIEMILLIFIIIINMIYYSFDLGKKINKKNFDYSKSAIKKRELKEVFKNNTFNMEELEKYKYTTAMYGLSFMVKKEEKLDKSYNQSTVSNVNDFNHKSSMSEMKVSK